MIPTAEIKILRTKLKALQYDGVPQTIADVFEVITATLHEQYGLKIRKEGKEVIAHEFVTQLQQLYQLQLDQLLADRNTEQPLQRTLEEVIAEVKTEQAIKRA